MLLRSTRDIFAPFAGFMLVGYEKQRSLERAGEEIDNAVEELRDSAADVREDLE